MARRSRDKSFKPTISDWIDEAKIVIGTDSKGEPIMGRECLHRVQSTRDGKTIRFYRVDNSLSNPPGHQGKKEIARRLRQDEKRELRLDANCKLVRVTKRATARAVRTAQDVTLHIALHGTNAHPEPTATERRVFDRALFNRDGVLK